MTAVKIQSNKIEKKLKTTKHSEKMKQTFWPTHYSENRSINSVLLHFNSCRCSLAQVTESSSRTKDSLLQRSAEQSFNKYSASCQLALITPSLLRVLIWHQTERIKEKDRGAWEGFPSALSQACHTAGAQCLGLILSCVTCSLLSLKYKPVS